MKPESLKRRRSSIPASERFLKHYKVSSTTGSTIHPPPDSSSCVDKTALSSWNFPSKILNYYLRKGIARFFDWQVECLEQDGVLNGANLVYSAPTSAGKTMVSDVLLYKTLLEKQKKAIIILPFVSITLEKVQSLKSLLRRLGFAIDSFAGNTNPKGGLARVDVAVCTIEKANNMINRLIQEGNLSDIGIIIVDELHMIGDNSRGYLLELLLTKLIYLQKRSDLTELQIVGMSATIPNLAEVANWLNAQLYITNYRPVPLFERIVNENILLDPKAEAEMKVATIEVSDLGIKSPEAPLIYSAIETVVDGYSALIFCSTKAQCENVSRMIAENIFEYGSKRKVINERTAQLSAKILEQVNGEKIRNLLSALKRCSVGLDANLERVVRYGVAFHHASLSIDERSLVENSFRDGTIRILCSTTTLSAGVNLPARRVLICSPYDYRGGLLDVTSYQQMIGRAGRKGIDIQGESFLFCKQRDLSQTLKLVHSSLLPVRSKLIKFVAGKGIDSQDAEVDTEHGSFLRAILEAIANGNVATVGDLKFYLSSTFFLHSNDEFDHGKHIDSMVKCLFTKNLITSDGESQSELQTTALGAAVIAAGITPQEGIFVFNELDKARRKLCLVNDLHLIYEVTPTYIANQLETIDWHNYMDIFKKLDKETQDVAEIIGVNERFLVARLATFSHLDRSNVQVIIHLRFYASLALYDLVREIPLLTVANKYRLSKGLVQSLQQQAAIFAGMLSTFCAKLGWSSMELLIDQFAPRLTFGVHRDLIDLMRLPCITGSLARALFKSGYETLVSLIYCEPEVIETILAKTIPFEVSKEEQPELNRTLATVYIPNLDQHVRICDLAKMIVKEARLLVEADVGQKLNFENQIPTPDEQPPITSINLLPVIDGVEKSFQTSTPNSKDRSLKNSLNLPSKEDQPVVNPIAGTSKSSVSWMSFDIDDIENLSWSRIETEVKTQNDHTRVKSPIVKKSEDSSILLKEDSFEDVVGDILLDTAQKEVSKVHSEPLNSVETSRKDEGEELPSPTAVSVIEDNLSDRSVAREKSLPSLVSLDENDLEDLFDKQQEDFPSPKVDAEVDQRFRSVESPELFHSDDSLLGMETTTKQPTVSASLDNSLSEDYSNDFFNNLHMSPVLYDCSRQTFRLITVNNDCVEALSEIFGNNNTQDDQKRNIAIHLSLRPVRKKVAKIFKRKPITSSSSNQFEGIHLPQFNCSLVAIYLCRLNTGQIYRFQTPELFEQLHRKWFSYLAKVDPLDRSKWTQPIKSDVKFHFAVYDVKKVISILVGHFAFNVDYLVHQVYWTDISVGFWILNPESEPFLIESVTRNEISQLILNHRLKYCDSIDEQLREIIPTDNEEEQVDLFKISAIFPLTNGLLEKLYELCLHRSYRVIEIPTRLCLALMELAGAPFDRDWLMQLKRKLIAMMSHIEKRITKTVGSRINLNSSKQVSQVLYGQLNLLSFDVRKPSASSSSKLSKRSSISSVGTTKLALIKLQENCGERSRLPTMIIDWRKLNHVLGTTLNGVASACVLNDNNTGQYWSVHGLCNEWTATGRIAMFNPNLISLDKDFEVKSVGQSLAGKVFDDSDSEEEKSIDSSILEPEKPTLIQVRKLIKARHGYRLVSADYCQLELRILAHFSKDETLLQLLNDTGSDVFKLISAKWKSIEVSEVTYEIRQQSKQICYGIIYGMGDESLANNLAVSVEQAKEFKQSFFRTYSKVEPFMLAMIEKCKENGYIETISGRRRFLPNIHSENRAEYYRAQRQCINSIIQGSAADVIKVSMVAMTKYITDRQIDAQLVLQMHDELMYEVAEASFVRFSVALKKQMENVSNNLKVDLPVKIHSGANWSDLEDVNVDLLKPTVTASSEEKLLDDDCTL